MSLRVHVNNYASKALLSEMHRFAGNALNSLGVYHDGNGLQFRVDSWDERAVRSAAENLDAIKYLANIVDSFLIDQFEKNIPPSLEDK